MTGSVFIVAAERSGDDLGAFLIDELRLQAPDMRLAGIGGDSMAARGVKSDFDISPLSILGLVEGLKALPTVNRLVKEAVAIIMPQNPDAVVLIDSWGFMLRVAWGLRKAGYEGKIIKYVAPQVWAMREGRSKVLAKAVDHLLTIHAFDAPYFEKHGLSVTYVGNPVFDADYLSGDDEALRARHDIESDKKIVSLFFGSRLSEVERLKAPLAGMVERLQKSFSDIVFVSPVAGPVKEAVRQAAAEFPALSRIIFANEAEKFDVFKASYAAVACSGTVTSQLASAGVPTVVTYKVSPLTYFFGKMLYKKDWVSLLNIYAEKTLLPELLQGECTAENLAETVAAYLRDPSLQRQTSENVLAAAKNMKGDGGPAAARAAEAVIQVVQAP